MIGPVSNSWSNFSSISTPSNRLNEQAPNGESAVATQAPFQQHLDEAQDSGQEANPRTTNSDNKTEETQTANAPSATTEKELTEEEKQDLRQLKNRDAEVKAHEQAHMAAAGGQAIGGASFDYETGPDGKRYAVGGEVSIDVSEGRTPEETAQRARTIRQAALAPANPSPQDRKIAAKAAAMQSEAQEEIQTESTKEAEQKSTEATKEEKVDEQETMAEEAAGIEIAAKNTAENTKKQDPSSSPSSLMDNIAQGEKDDPLNPQKGFPGIQANPQSVAKAYENNVRSDPNDIDHAAASVAVLQVAI